MRISITISFQYSTVHFQLATERDVALMSVDCLTLWFQDMSFNVVVKTSYFLHIETMDRNYVINT